MVAAGKDMTPAMRQIAGILGDAAERAFRTQADPSTGKAWKELSDVTVARRKARGRGPRPILIVGGLLKDIQTDYGPDYAAAGSPMLYAPTHQFGAAQGAFGRTSRGAPIPWGNIPARPFLGLNEDDVAEIFDLIGDHLSP
jgi:phage virion morphogenesis protein